MSYYEDLVDLRVEAIITEAKPRLLWLQLEGLLNSNNNEGRSLTVLENEGLYKQADLLQPLWVCILMTSTSCYDSNIVHVQYATC